MRERTTGLALTPGRFWAAGCRVASLVDNENPGQKEEKVSPGSRFCCKPIMDVLEGRYDQATAGDWLLEFQSRQPLKSDLPEPWHPVVLPTVFL